MLFEVRPVKPEDWCVWERMRYALWPGDDEEHGNVTTAFFAGSRADPQHVLLAERQGEVVGFAELSIRTELPSRKGVRVGYIEGLYVVEHYRHCGVARSLLAAARTWARHQGCEAFASDREERIIIDPGFRTDRGGTTDVSPSGQRAL